MIAVSVSDLVMLKRAASAPEDIVTVADSETWIVAAVAEVAMFSAAVNVEDEVKVGAVVSGAVRVVAFKLATGTITYELCPGYDHSNLQSAPPPCSCIQISIE